MAGTGITVDSEGFIALDERLSQLSHIDLRKFLETVGTLVESSTRRRIKSEKTSPSGTPWPEWSEGYAASKHGPSKAHQPHPGQTTSAGGHSILMLSGHLLDSISNEVSGDEVEVGSNLVYAATHQYGDSGRNIPQREFLGLSASDTDDLNELIHDFIEELL